MKYLVTGGAGFIGSNLVDALIERGHEVAVIDNLVTGKKENVNTRAVFYQADITDLGQIEPLFKGIDGVFHVAAVARIQPSFENPDLYFRTNALGTRNVLAAAKKHGVKKVVYSASSSAYGETPLPADEAAKITSQSLHPYGSTKRMGEMLMSDLGTMTGGPKTACLRYFNVYGPRQTMDSDGPYPTVIGLFLGLKKKGKPLLIVPDGNQRRDFTWVGDVANANILAMESDKVGNAEIINIGSGKNYSIWDVARAVLEAPQATPEELIASGKCSYAPQRKGEVRETLANNSKARELIGWEPKMNFFDGIKKLLEI
ncbi:MAG: NAD-dependent epimerase/dehydratase family protein [Candidatus Pacebacteria bacterium]|nr:NAD-dependent epimerase/dehydratase family protein [Candidatus Paceibacterota bacterium]